MTRTNSTLSLAVAALATVAVMAPAAAADQYRSPDSVVSGSDRGSTSATPAGYRSTDSVVATSGDRANTAAIASGSARALLAGAVVGPRSSETDGGGYRSADAILVGHDRTRSLGEGTAGAQYTDALLRAAPSPPSTVRVVEVSDGFAWADALIGALGALALLLVGFGTARTVSQHRHATAGSHA